MCGIFSYIGASASAPSVILDGLKTLEYRGYDSWGIAVKYGRKIALEKNVGKIGGATVSLPKSTVGIGHTRWATHGGVTVKNAHPHLDCTEKLALLHNGIIENYETLRHRLRSKRHRFRSETDTEVAVHMIEENMQEGMDFLQAVRNAFVQFSGLNAIVVMNSDTEQIVAAKNGSPLVVGRGSNAFYLASDASGIVRHTKEIHFLKDNELVVLDTSVALYDVTTGNKLPVRFETIDWKVEEASLGNFPHFMIKEIFDQPKVIRTIANTYADQIDDLADVIKTAKGTFLIGAGTAYHASLAGVYLFSKIAKEHLNTAMASEFNYLEDFLTKRSLVIALSQSGETIDIVEPLTRAKGKGSTIFALVNTLGSTIYRMADRKLLLGAGPEKAVASTKAYIAKLSILLMLSFAMIKRTSEAKKLLLSAADEVERLLKDQPVRALEQLSDTLSKKQHIFTVGRGLSFATALEAALKIKEVSYIHTEGLAGGELKHGTIALIEKGTPCIVFAPSDETYEAIISNAMEIKARGGTIIGISPIRAEVFDHWIEVKDIKDASIIPQIIPAQLLSYLLAVRKGFDPDKPRNLAKSVTVK
ncbi:MAG: glutamine--fructose-6-phosphate transaminase (isomerizing) [bacterium]|nr:glutamine--fructose-6-phosphate transaminase (isomerizing) [bacterium]